MANNLVKNFQFPKEGAWEGTLSLLCSWVCFGKSAQIYISIHMPISLISMILMFHPFSN